MIEHDASVAAGARQGHQGSHIGTLTAVGDSGAHSDGVVLWEGGRGGSGVTGGRVLVVLGVVMGGREGWSVSDLGVGVTGGKDSVGERGREVQDMGRSGMQMLRYFLRVT